MAESGEPDQMNKETEQTSKTTKQTSKTTKQAKLKYLDFVHVAAIQALVCVSRLYDWAKESAGPLKPGFQTVEGTVKTVVGPVYEKFRDLPFEILKFVDAKVGAAVEEVDRHLPSSLKHASSQAYTAAQKAPEVARSISDEVRRAGIVNTATDLAKAAYSKAEPAAKTLYTKYEPVAERYAVSAWKSLNKLPVFPQVARVVLPTAAHWTKKYNGAVRSSAEKGYAFAGYLPVVPVERIAKVFGGKNKKAE